MARIAGVDIPDKRGEISLSYIYGIGRNMAAKILLAAKVDKEKKSSSWSDDEISRVRESIQSMCQVEGVLKSEIRSNKKRLMDIASYRGIRHRIGLPCRGQHTKNNARTKKGKKKTVANKKK